MENLKIRLAKARDKEAIRANLKICWLETYADRLGPKNTETLLKSLASDDIGGVLPQKDEMAVVCEIDGRIVGITVGAVRQQSAYIWGCYLQKQHQRLGIGRAMFRTLFNTLDEHEGVIAYVLDSSREAQIFYKALGFKRRNEDQQELVPGVTLPAHMYSVLATDLVVS